MNLHLPQSLLTKSELVHMMMVPKNIITPQASRPCMGVCVFRSAPGAGLCAVFGPRDGGGVWHKASVSDCLPLAVPIGLSPLLILTLCGPERVLVGGGGYEGKKKFVYLT